MCSIECGGCIDDYQDARAIFELLPGLDVDRRAKRRNDDQGAHRAWHALQHFGHVVGIQGPSPAIHINEPWNQSRSARGMWSCREGPRGQQADGTWGNPSRHERHGKPQCGIRRSNHGGAREAQMPAELLLQPYCERAGIRIPAALVDLFEIGQKIRSRRKLRSQHLHERWGTRRRR